MLQLTAVQKILSDLYETQAERERQYKYFHQHPELSMKEDHTAQTIIDILSKAGIETKRVGKTGVVAEIKNGEGPVVAMRADIDALPIKENSGKDYNSTVSTQDENGKTVGVSHACGHDFHISSLLGALKAFNKHKDAWRGTYIGVFQPGEETAQGAKSLVENGITRIIPKPDVYLGQHVLGAIPAGTVGIRSGAFLTTAASIRVHIFGKGSHGSMPELSVDPVIVASSIVLKLQTIVSRELAAKDYAIVTVGAINAGSKSNIIPDDAELLINTRTYSEDTQKFVHSAIERIVRGECELARCPKKPEFTYYDRYPLTNNDQNSSLRVRKAFDEYFGEDSVNISRASASEDFSIVANAFNTPYAYWGLGGFEDMKNAPGNHNPAFAPDLQPTLNRGLESAVVAACAWLACD
ncbi:amidohydrolase [Gardnerella vaginalis]|uniref:M20 family metallopeptidase n=1 Tax=Gardnerella piotii TaxID=2792977 RepID=A0ABU5MRQ3_9BIFI|nr:M20 family metallopeptidase [Gardnerella piotii]EPI47451.1 amidohydrolase [Gardnerella vaginalis JCP8151B]EPI60815.1 amidohydrolase [Gardnerella vaginalis JCP8070]RFT26468.1 amidohydrolase [Gardnerella vaginalis]MDZ7545014.1 M20 family metallopeptidase [Gardnerella piotii]MDZ7552742.1 M20 family metallopeptidase [Gardnerella piotii]